jgi:hypothetical protein
LREWGIEISAGQINELLIGDRTFFHDETDAFLSSALPGANHPTVDDKGTRHPGNSAYVTQIGDECFAWFETTASKSRVNFFQLVGAHHTDYQINDQALTYMRQQRLPQQPLQSLPEQEARHFPEQKHWE